MVSTSLRGRKAARQALVERITDALKADDRFVAAWLTGSMGRHGGDELSDIDLSVVVAPNHFATLCQRPWMVAGRTTDERLKLFQQFGDPVIIHENNNNAPGDGTFTSVTYRADALTVDWTLIAQENAIRPGMSVPLFSKVEIPVQKHKSLQAQEERARAASEKVAFFWMMLVVTIKYMLRRDTVYFHMLLDTLYRVEIEISDLVEGRSWVYKGGSQVSFAITQREQRVAVQNIAGRMQALMPKVVAMGGYVPDDPMSAVEYLLNSNPIDDTTPENALSTMTETDRENVRRIIKILGHMSKRIGMYIGSNDPWSLTLFLFGFHSGAAISGVRQDTSVHDSAYERVLSERGWKHSSLGPFREMQERGMDNDAIIQEMIAIEVETWKRSYNITD